MLIFIIWTVLVKTVDVHYILGVGYLGFYSMNAQIAERATEFARADLFDKLTDVGLYLSFAIVACFGILGIYQWAKRKSIKKVDPILFVLLATYVIAVAFYAIFELTKINYSPLSTPEKLKASYPSTHIYFFVVFLLTGLVALFHYVKVNKYVQLISYCLAIALCGAYSFARLYSLNHYFSDVIASILLGSFSVSLFVALKLDFIKPVEEKEE